MYFVIHFPFYCIQVANQPSNLLLYPTYYPMSASLFESEVERVIHSYSCPGMLAWQVFTRKQRAKELDRDLRTTDDPIKKLEEDARDLESGGQCGRRSH